MVSSETVLHSRSQASLGAFSPCVDPQPHRGSPDLECNRGVERQRAQAFAPCHGLEVPMPVILMGVLGGMLVDGLLGPFVGPGLLAVTYMLLHEWLRQNPIHSASEISGPPS